MAARGNEFDRIVQDLKEELSGYRRQAEKSHAIPFGQEQLSARDARKRYGQMSRGEIEKLTPEQRKDMLKLLGTGPVLQQLRKG